MQESGIVLASPILNMPPIGHKIAVRRYYAIFSKVPGNIISYRYLSNNDNYFELHAFDKCLKVQQQFCSKVESVQTCIMFVPIVLQ